jgi:hypothetical protein
MVTAFIILLGFLMFVGLMIMIEIRQEGVVNDKRFVQQQHKYKPFSMVVSEDIYVPEKLTGKYTKNGILILPKSERGW